MKFEGHLKGEESILKDDPTVAAVEFLLKQLGIHTTSMSSRIIFATTSA
ncbi:MAG: hypothetical protein ACUVT8_06715 [Armatimonadota bacterium]